MKKGFKLKNMTAIIACLAVTAMFVCCKDDDNGNGNGNDGNTPPVLTTSAASDVTATTAYIGGNITDAGKPEYILRGVCYDIYQLPTTNNTPVQGTGTGNFKIQVSGLTPNTTYYARAYAINVTGTVYGDEVSFKTLLGTPTLTTTAATAVTYSTATLGGNITNAGTPAYTERGVCYATTQNPTTGNNKTPVEGTGTGSFSIGVSDLIANTTYYVRAYATNIHGTVYGNELSFKTQKHQGEPEMVFVEGGTFVMGGTMYSDEQPIHQVTLSDFKIGKYEVTQGQWEAVMGRNPSYFTNGDNYPVENVSWNDIVGTSGSYMELNGIKYYANGFIYKLNQLTGKQYRLPTEAEWEYAARGGKQSNGYTYSGSNTVGNVAWYRDNSGGSTHQVGTKQANELGIYDMSGNVYEWVGDRYGGYTSGAQTNPTGPATGSARVLRGGSWIYTARFCRVSLRYFYTPGYRNSFLGLRLVVLP
jgi:formylglycine-generating enzyme required for sulfatase activity